jgi:hypothetical protein
VPIVARRQGDQLLIDLRTVQPRQDQTLLDMLAGPLNSPAETASESAIPASV